MKTPHGAGIVNAGEDTLHIGGFDRLGSVVSVGDVVLNPRARVFGSVTTENRLRRRLGAIVTGPISEGVDLTLPDLTAFSVEFPAAKGKDIEVGSKKWRKGHGAHRGARRRSANLAPGVYGRLTARHGGLLHLRSGTYFFDSVDLQAGSELRLETRDGPVYMYVRRFLKFSGLITNARGAEDKLFIGYFGVAPVSLDAPMTATLVAPRAPLRLGAPHSRGHVGAFFAKSIRVLPGVRVRLVPFEAPWVGDPIPPTPSPHQHVVAHSLTGLDGVDLPSTNNKEASGGCGIRGTFRGSGAASAAMLLLFVICGRRRGRRRSKLLSPWSL